MFFLLAMQHNCDSNLVIYQVILF